MDRFNQLLQRLSIHLCPVGSSDLYSRSSIHDGIVGPEHPKDSQRFWGPLDSDPLIHIVSPWILELSFKPASMREEVKSCWFSGWPHSMEHSSAAPYRLVADGGRHQAWWGHHFITFSCWWVHYLNNNKSGLMRSHDFLPLLQNLIFMLHSMASFISGFLTSNQSSVS